MYQLATPLGGSSSARHFLEAASATPATPANLAFVDTLKNSLRIALRADDIEPLRRDVLRAKQSGTDIHDLLAAAEYEIHETMLDQGLSVIHDTAVRLGSIIRDVRRQADALPAPDRRTRPRQAVFA
jgi:hypothetical protein